MAVANGVRQWVRRHHPSPRGEARPDHFPHASGSANAHFPSPSGAPDSGAAAIPARRPDGRGGRSVRTVTTRPVQAFVSESRRTSPVTSKEHTDNPAGTCGKGAGCPLTAFVGDSDGAHRAI